MLIGVQKALVRTVGANPVYIILARILSGSLFINFHHLEISFDIFVLIKSRHNHGRNNTSTKL